MYVYTHIHITYIYIYTHYTYNIIVVLVAQQVVDEAAAGVAVAADGDALVV